jgi:hypothetical protein
MIERIAQRFEPKLRQALLDSWDYLRKSFSEKQIVSALDRAGVIGVMDLFDSLGGGFNDAFQANIEQALGESGRISVGLLPKGAIVSATQPFTLFNANTVQAINNYTSTMIKEIKNSTRDAIRQSLHDDIISGQHPVSTARNFRSNIGLTQKQYQAVDNYRKYLESGDITALKRNLRDKRSDNVIRRAIEGNKKLPKDKIDKLVNRYREKFIKHRAEVIARTESLRAVSIGHHQAMLQLKEQGALNFNLRRFWIVANDERLRPAHKAIPGLNPIGRNINEPFVTPLGPLMYPRDPSGTADNTVQCRCRIIYKVVK